MQSILSVMFSKATHHVWRCPERLKFRVQIQMWKSFPTEQRGVGQPGVQHREREEEGR